MSLTSKSRRAGIAYSRLNIPSTATMAVAIVSGLTIRQRLMPAASNAIISLFRCIQEMASTTNSKATMCPANSKNMGNQPVVGQHRFSITRRRITKIHELGKVGHKFANDGDAQQADKRHHEDADELANRVAVDDLHAMTGAMGLYKSAASGYHAPHRQLRKRKIGSVVQQLCVARADLLSRQLLSLWSGRGTSVAETMRSLYQSANRRRYGCVLAAPVL